MTHLKKVIKNVLLKISIPVCEENLKVKRLTAAVRYCHKTTITFIVTVTTRAKCSRELSRAGNELKHNVSEIRSISIIGVGGNMALMT
jgi:hypothetical protein